ncbi:alpha/beta hydrolase family protein [Shewanella sp. AS16]|uniref:DUF3530 family protein n=1 Tax=Shewanella sp. AS16 TaxID=2907625 RepID=UPI001F42B147|nr:DUF3530 family protein [Shewanella sp. AS16]MCE9685846.1 alpha/beta hydrolase family protein [Shewanella sp. AS16]
MPEYRSIYVGLLLLLSLAFPPECRSQDAPQPQAAAATEGDKQQRLAYLPAAEVGQIRVGDESVGVLTRPWQGEQHLGAALLLADLGSPPDAPGLIDFLRHGLNPAGWASISLTPPRARAAPNFATAATEISKAGEAQLSYAAGHRTPKFSREQDSQHKTAQENFLQQTLTGVDALSAVYPGKRLVIADGQSAALVIALLQQQQIPAPDMLVVINPFIEDETQNQALAAQLASITVPVLDLQSPDGHPASRLTALQRHTLASVHGPGRYRQQALALDLRQATAWQECLQQIKGFAYLITRQG